MCQHFFEQLQNIFLQLWHDAAGLRRQREESGGGHAKNHLLDFFKFSFLLASGKINVQAWRS